MAVRRIHTPHKGGLKVQHPSRDDSRRTSLYSRLAICFAAILLLVTVAVPAASADNAEGDESVRDLAGLISTGHKHACAIEDGQVYCFGDGDWGQLGGALSTGTPVAISGVNTATSVAAGDTHNCALLANETVTCWGRNFWGQLGHGGTNAGIPGLSANSTPAVVPGLTGVVSLAAGQHNTCAVKDDGSVWCWGYNGEGQLAQEGVTATTTDDDDPSIIPLEVQGVSGAEQVSMSWGHACALLSNGAIKCWGEGSEGRLGNGGTSSAFTAVQVSLYTDFVAVSAGLQFTCAIRQGGQAVCWGDNFYTQLGNGMGTDSSTPVNVTGLDDAVSISAGEQHACAVRDSGEVWCWGRDVRQALGAPGIGAIGSPVPVHSIPAEVATAAAVSANDDHSCVVTYSKYFYCWGQNDYGEIGNGSDGNFGSASYETAQRVIMVTPDVYCDGQLVTINLQRNGGVVTGSTIDDVILGTAGNDDIKADDGDDYVCGLEGGDTITGGDGDDTIHGDEGIDKLYGNSGEDEMHGGIDDDKMWGGPDNDTMNGDDGNDTIRTNAGDDVANGGDGEDRIYGNAGNDELNGDADADRLFGNADNDEINGGAGDDSLYGHTGVDTMNGDNGDDLLNGSSGNDIMNGGNNTDTLRGGSDDDTMNGGNGDNDVVVGQGGDDDMSGGSGSGDVCRGKSGTDTADASCETIQDVP